MRVLDIGCGSGAFGEQVKRRNQGCQVIGVTISQEEAALATKRLDAVFICDLDDLETHDLGAFDCIVCSHVLEHIYSPHELLIKVRNILSREGKLVVALPNVLFWKQRLEFLRGRFRYTDGGLMDRTHLRFYDWKTARELVRQAGFDILTEVADGYLPLPFLRKYVGSVASRLDSFASNAMPGLLSTQFIIVARKTQESH